jgi:hypothetical protein
MGKHEKKSKHEYPIPFLPLGPLIYTTKIEDKVTGEKAKGKD